MSKSSLWRFALSCQTAVKSRHRFRASVSRECAPAFECERGRRGSVCLSDDAFDAHMRLHGPRLETRPPRPARARFTGQPWRRHGEERGVHKFPDGIATNEEVPFDLNHSTVGRCLTCFSGGLNPFCHGDERLLPISAFPYHCVGPLSVRTAGRPRITRGAAASSGGCGGFGIFLGTVP